MSRGYAEEEIDSGLLVGIYRFDSKSVVGQRREFARTYRRKSWNNISAGSRSYLDCDSSTSASCTSPSC